MSDTTLRRAEGLILIVVLVSYVLAYVVRRLRRRRPEFNIGKPLIVGLALRLMAVAAINASSLQSQLRGGDEDTFLGLARILATTPWGRGFRPHGPFQLQTDVFAAQIKLADLSPTALRVTQIGIAMLGLVLILAAVHDLAAPRAARLAAWLLVLEPASIFFNSGLSKEPLMELATGMVVLGGIGAEFPLHEGIASYLSDPARRVAVLCQGEELGHKWRSKSIFAFAYARVLGAVDLVEGLVFDGDVGRVADDDVVAAFFQHGQEQRAVFGCVGEGHEGGAVIHGGECVWVGAVDEGVADSQVEGECWRRLQGCEA